MSFPGASYGGKSAGNTPLFSLAAAVAFFALVVCLVIFTDPEDKEFVVLLIGLCVTTVPSLIASAFSERASRDIRNGVVTAKVEQALENTGVTEVAQTALKSAPISLSALGLLVSDMQARQNAQNAHDAANGKDTDNDR